MARHIHFKDPSAPEMTELLKSIPTSPGTCIFMDVVRSTQLKYEETLVIGAEAGTTCSTSSCCEPT